MEASNKRKGMMGLLQQVKKMGTVLFLCCAVLASMTGCRTSEPDMLALGVVGEVKDFSLMVLSYELLEEVQTSEILSYQPTQEGNRYLKVKMTVKNIGEESRQLLPLEYNTQTDLVLAVQMATGEEGQAVATPADGANARFESVNLMGYQEGLADKFLAPQEEITGYVFFEVPSSLAEENAHFWLEASLGRINQRFALSAEPVA